MSVVPGMEEDFYRLILAIAQRSVPFWRANQDYKRGLLVRHLSVEFYKVMAIGRFINFLSTLPFARDGDHFLTKKSCVVTRRFFAILLVFLRGVLGKVVFLGR
jgi:hypothetical protein